jgi:hypothetical protein
MPPKGFQNKHYNWGHGTGGAGGSNPRPGGASGGTPGEDEIEDATVVPPNIPQHVLNKSTPHFPFPPISPSPLPLTEF